MSLVRIYTKNRAAWMTKYRNGWTVHHNALGIIAIDIPEGHARGILEAIEKGDQ
jgi:hypothetical protein